MASFTSVPSAAVVSWPSSGSPPPVASDTRTPAASPVAASSSAATATAPAANPAPAAQASAPSAEQLGKIVSQLQSQVNSAGSDLQFSVDHDTGKSVVKVMDQSTQKVIWQFPSEQALQISKDIERFQKGIMVNQQA